MFELFQHYCGFCMAGETKNNPECARDKRGSFDMTPPLHKCNEELCPFMKAIMNKIKWTRKLPKVPGWYWFKGQKTSVKIVEIIELRMLGLQFNDSRLPRDLKVWPGKWSGPIPPPSEK